MYAADKPFDQRKNTASHQVETVSLYRQNQRERERR